MHRSVSACRLTLATRPNSSARGPVSAPLAQARRPWLRHAWRPLLGQSLQPVYKYHLR
uniref:Uncharacterized protein n=1 Tax=Arundo donax TaxID=35708 RepID=A0A0A9B741_ARUDO